MASTSYLARVIVRPHTEGTDDFTGSSYDLMLAAKSIGSPVQPPNTVESTTLEDDCQTYEMGIKKSDAIEITGNLNKDDLTQLDTFASNGTVLDIVHLYGTKGLGEVAMYGYTGTVSATPDSVGGVDEILGMTVTAVPKTAPKKLNLKATKSAEGKFTLSAE